LINNVLYVVILSAALDLVGPDIPKSVVLLADVLPSFLMKLIAPYFIHVVPYPIRILLLVTISTVGMLLIALTPEYTDGGTVSTKMAGVILASLSSGMGELSFLGMTHFYGPFSLAAWGSGTGAAGLVGAGAYAVATTSVGLSVKSTLLASSFLPVIMLVSFFTVLPLEPLRRKHARDTSAVLFENEDNVDREGDVTADREDEGLLGDSQHSTVSLASKKMHQSWQATFVNNLKRARGLFFP
jgi:battenin